MIIDPNEKPQAKGLWLGDTFHPLAEAPATPHPLEAPPKRQEQVSDTVEVCRSFTRKINLKNYGGYEFESADFFCSRKITCKREAEAMVSQELVEVCVEEIHSTVKDYIAFTKQRMQEVRAAQEARAAEMREAERQEPQRQMIPRPTAHPTRQR